MAKSTRKVQRYADGGSIVSTLTEQEKRLGAIPGIEKQLAAAGYKAPAAQAAPAPSPEPDTRFSIPEFTREDRTTQKAIGSTRVGETRNTFEDLTPEQVARNNQIMQNMSDRAAASRAAVSAQAQPQQNIRGEYYGLSGQKFYDDTPIQQQEAAPDLGSLSLGQMAGYAVKSRRESAARKSSEEDRRLAAQLAAQERIASIREEGEASRYRGTRGLDVERLGLEREKIAALQPGYAAEAKLRETQAGLTAAQTEATMYGLEAVKRTSAAQKVLDNPQKYSPEQVAGAKAFLDKDLQDKIAFEQAKARAKYEAENASYPNAVVARAKGGIIMGYEDGGDVVGTERQQYLKTPQSAIGAIGERWGSMIRPFTEPIVNLITPVPTPTTSTPITPKAPSYGMELTPEAKEQMGTLGRANGGFIPGYADGGAIGNPAQNIHPELAQYGQYLQAAAQSGVTPVPFDQYRNLLQTTRGAMNQTPSQFAKGGAIPVAGKMLEGPGTETSDSIPAVIDGHRPAALSTGEFVIPAHIVRAKGTEFFDKLLAQYADNGEKDGE